MNKVDKTGYTVFGGQNFSFQWIIINFDDVAKMAPPVTITSPGFIDDYMNTWELTLYRRPLDADDCIDVKVKVASDTFSPRFLVAHLQCMNTDSSIIPELSELMVSSYFQWKASDTILQTIVKLPCKLSSKVSEQVKDDTLAIYCKTYCKDNTDTDVKWVAVGSNPVMDKSAEFISNFKNLKNKNDSLLDFSICVGEETYQAHKAILAARSSVFHAMLTVGMTESNTNSLRIQNFHSEVVAGMLKYIYTNETEILKEDALDYYRIAHAYDLNGLRVEAENILATTVTVDNAMEIYELGSLYNSLVLMNNAKKFIKHNVGPVLAKHAGEILNKGK